MRTRSVTNRKCLVVAVGAICFATNTLHAAISDYVTMQIVAHQDDDILFMNLEVRNMVAAGYGCVTVYVTAGEADGSLDGSQDREYYAASRQEGARAAFADMMGVPNEPGTWDRSTLAVANGNLVEVDTLVPTRTPIQSSYSYTRAAFVQSLIDLLNQFHPSVVRTLDPQPYKAGTFNPDCTGLTTNQCCSIQPPADYVGFDNTDHTFTARFVDEALKSYNGATGN